MKKILGATKQWKYGIQLQFREAFHRLFDSCNNHRRKYCGKGNQKMCEKQYQNEEAFYQHGQTMFRTTMRTFLGQSISQFQTQFTIQTVSWQRRTCRNSKSYKIVCLLTYLQNQVETIWLPFSFPAH